MKKRTKIVWTLACIGILLGVIAGIALTRMLGTRYPDAAAQANGVYMECMEEPSRELLSYQICNTSENPVYGDLYQLEYKFLGRWYRLMYRAGATYDLGGIVVGEYTDTLKCKEKPMQMYAFLPPGKYRLMQRFYTVKDYMLYENRDQNIALYLEFELD